MKLVVVILFLYLVEKISHIQTTVINAASLKCPAPKQIYRIDNDFAVQLNQPNVVYIYLAKYNSFLVLNTELTFFVILDGTNKIIFNCDTNTGNGAIYNPKIEFLYGIAENKIFFDISKILQGDFSIAEKLVNLSFLYTNKVIGTEVDLSQPGYANVSLVLQDFASTTDYKKWLSYEDGHYINTALYDFNMNITNTAYNVLNQYNNQYPVEWGGMIFFVVASEHYKIKEECLFAFIDVMVTLVRKRDFGFSPKLMDKLYDVVSGQKEMTKKEAIEKYEALLEMI